MSRTSEVKVASREAASSVPQYALYGEAVADNGERRVSIARLSDKLKARGWRIQPHTHPHYSQLLIIRSGGGATTMEGRTRPFRAPAILVVPSLLVHGFAYEEQTDGWVVTVADSYLKEITVRAPEFAEIFAGGHCIEYPPLDESYAEVQRSIAKLEAEQRRSALCRDIATEGLLIAVLVNVLRKVQDSAPPGPVLENGSAHEKYRRFIAMVEEHYGKNWSLDRFADALGTTVNRLRAICRDVSGESPVRILNNRIILEAKRSLTYTSMNVSEIAYRLGFEDPSYFSRFFRSRCGETPSQFKAHRRNAARLFDH